jgi:uncharacterized protein (TIGR02246 family)
MLGVVALAVAGLSAQQKAAANGDEAAIAKIRTAYNLAITGQDAAGIAKLYATDGVEMPPNAPAAKGRAAIEKFHKDLAQQVMIHGSSITPTDTHISGNMAYDIGTYKQQMMPMKGGGISDDHGKYVVVLRKDGGSWLIVAAIYNSDLPLPAPAAPKK